MIQIEIFKDRQKILSDLGSEFFIDEEGRLRVRFPAPTSEGAGGSSTESSETSSENTGSVVESGGGETSTEGPESEGAETSGEGAGVVPPPSGGSEETPETPPEASTPPATTTRYGTRPLSETLSVAVPPMPRPLFNVPFDEPTFGTKIVRVTDDSDGGWIHRTGLMAISPDDTKIHLMKRGGAGDSNILDFDPDSMKVLNRYYVFPQPDTWFYTRPSTAFKIEGKRLRAYDAISRKWSTEMDWSSVLPAEVTGLTYRRHDVRDRRFCCQFHTNTGSYQGLCVLDALTGELIFFKKVPGAKPDMDYSGRYVRSVVGENLFIDLDAPGGPNVTVYPGNFPPEWPWHEAWGNGFSIGPDGLRHDFRRLDFDTLETHILIPQPPIPDWSHGVHFTTVDRNGNWAVASQFRTNAGIPLQQFDDEVFLVSATGREPTKRIAHHRSSWAATQDYYDMPRAVGSYSGRLVLWDSNWWSDETRRRDCYVARIY